MQNPKIDELGNKFWYNDIGQRHRTNGPAIEWADGSKNWYVNGKKHRTDGPAIIGANGTKCWLIDGKKHRTDGPATEYENGIKQWWINGFQLTAAQCYLFNYLCKNQK